MSCQDKRQDGSLAGGDVRMRAVLDLFLVGTMPSALQVVCGGAQGQPPITPSQCSTLLDPWTLPHTCHPACHEVTRTVRVTQQSAQSIIRMSQQLRLLPSDPPVPQTSRQR